MASTTIGHFPYAPSFNPFQRLFADALESAGLRVARIPNRRWFPIESALAHEIDLLQMDWPHSFYTGRGALARGVKRWMYRRGLRRLRQFPLVWTAHNLHAHDSAQPRDEIAMIQKLVDCCDGIIVMSRAAEALLRETYRLPDQTRVAMIPHGHYIGAYPDDATKAESRRKLGIVSGTRVVLSLGRMLRYKGLDLLVRAFCEVARRGDLLLLAGPVMDKGLEAELHRMIERDLPAGADIRIHPRLVAADELQVYFNACDVVALPFRKILNSGSMLLAMSFGRCVVAPRAGSLPEAAYTEAYFAYDPDDPEGLARELKRALGHPDLSARGLAAREYVREQNDWGKIGQQARRLYEDILGTAGTGREAESGV